MDWSRWKVSVNHAARVRCEPAWRLERAWSDRLDDYDVWLVWAGRGRMRLRDRRIELRPGVALWMRPGGLYSADHDPDQPLGVSFAHFDLRDRRGRRPRSDNLPGEVYQVADVPYAESLMRRVTHLRRRAVDRADATAGAVAGALLGSLLMDLVETGDRDAWSAASATERHHRQVVEPIAARIATAPHDVPRVAELAGEAGYSADHFARVFGEVTGRTPREYIVHARIDRARQLLDESTLTVSQVADALGYRDVYFFSRQFKQTTGQSPTAYRRGRAANA